MYTIDKDFSCNAYGTEIIEATGRDFEINYSSILSKLIQECGRLCERFSSDLFIDWEGIVNKINNKTLKTSTYLFGIREDGVDSSDFILARYETNGKDAVWQYRKIYRLDIFIEDDGRTLMRLYEINKPYTER